MAISFLPPSQILANTRLQLQATTEPLQKFVEYVDGNWVQNTTWPPSCWSLNKQWASSPIMKWQWEGWHNGLKKCASGRAQMPLYMLVHLLHKEAYLVAHQVRLASKRKLQNYHSIHAKISSYWEQYAFHQNSAAQLLKACSHVNGPIVQKLNMIRD